MRTAAKIISFVFHPLLMATYLTLLLGVYFPGMIMLTMMNLLLLTAFVFVFTFFVPALNLLLLRLLGTLRSLQLESHDERKQPFVFVSIMYLIVAIIFHYRFSNDNFNKLMMIVVALVMSATLLTFFIKVSVHALAMSGMVGIIVPLIKLSPPLLLPTVIVIIMTGVVISSRLYLNAHTLKETVIGSITGLIVGYGGMVVMF